MIYIELDDNCVFTYSSQTPAVGIWKHPLPNLSGTPYQVGWIQFNSYEQLSLFMEMAQFALDKGIETNEKNS